MKKLILAVTAVLLTTGCSTAWLVSNEQERQLGLAVDEQIEEEYTMLPDNHPAVAWANQLVQAMVPASSRFRDPAEIEGYKVHVIDDDSLVNAFAAPGGYVYFATGIILSSKNCGELAGVVGHELAHVTERHSAKQLASSSLATTLTGLVLGDGIPATVAQSTWNFLQSTSFSRKDESRADEVGVKIMYETGYNPHALADFFETLDEQSGSRPPQFLSSHPDPGNRASRIREQIADSYGSSVVRGRTQTYDCIGTTRTLAQAQDMLRR